MRGLASVAAGLGEDPALGGATRAGVLVRGTRPFITTMSQNSQLNGQPRELRSINRGFHAGGGIAATVSNPGGGNADLLAGRALKPGMLHLVDRVLRVYAPAVLGIDEVHAGMLPGEKAELVRRLQSTGVVAMVGDGINDAPALMQANVGIAMGGGTGIAIDSADIVILNSRLESVASAREISRASYRKMLQNVSLAFLFNGVGVPLAATGLVYPVWAMAAMAASVTTIFFNSLWGKPGMFFQAILSVGRPLAPGAWG